MIIINIVVTLLFILFRLFRYDLAVMADGVSFGLEITLGWLDRLVQFLYVLWAAFCIVYSIVKMKPEKWRAFVPISVCASVLFFAYIFPATGLYQKLEYGINISGREKTVEMVKSGEIADYMVDMHKARAPYRHTSYTRTIFVQSESDAIKVMFHTCQGLGVSKVLIYASDDSGISETDFVFGTLTSDAPRYSDIKKEADNWYSASVKP